MPREREVRLLTNADAEPLERSPRDWDIGQIVQDLKEPLQAVVLETHLLDALVARGDDVEMRTTLDRITHDIMFVDGLVQDLADMCALDAGTFALRRARTELRLLIQHVIDRVVTPAERVRVFLDAPEPITLAIDDARIERVVASFVRNAVASSARSTGIVVRLEKVGDGARVSVTGDVRTRERGVGLVVAQRIVEAHGGRVGIENLRALSARRYFELPAT